MGIPKLSKSSIRARLREPLRKATCLVVTAVMAASAVLSAAPPAMAQAAPRTMEVTSSKAPGSSYGTSSMHIMRTSVELSTGGVAYCGQGYLKAPSAGDRLNRYGSLGIPELDYVAYHGYDGKVVKSLYGMDAERSEIATGIAIHLAIADQRFDVLQFDTRKGPRHGNQHYMQRWERLTDAAVKDGAWRLYQEGLAYKRRGGGGVEAGCATYWTNPRREPGTYKAWQGLVTAYKGGKCQIVKQSANPGCTDGNPLYSLEGAQFAIKDPKGGIVARLTTDASGNTPAVDLAPGAYTVTETKAPEGYVLDKAAHRVVVESGKTAKVVIKDQPLNDPAGILVGKFDGDKHYTGEGNLPQGSASLEGAEFTVRHYPGFFDSEKQAEESGLKPRTWVLKTNKNGFAMLDEPYLVSGDELYYMDGIPTLPRGTIIIRETKAPEGYNLNTEFVSVQKIKKPGDASIESTYNTPKIPEAVIRGGVRVSKRDLESGLPTPLGSASIDGTRFDVKTLNEETVVVDGVTYGKGDVVATLTISDGEAATAADALPYGSYSIQEVAAGDGYLITDGTAHEFRIERDGEVVDGAGGPFKNQVKRGDVELVKVRESDMGRLAGVPFRITSKTTGESHVIVTDENGQAKTSAAWNKHTHRTNANDAVADEAGYDPAAGVWFGLTTEGTTTAPNDDLGALPYDTYDVEELPVAANDGLQLVSIEGIVIKRDSTTVDLGTVDDRDNLVIHTTASDAADGDKLIGADDEAVVTDHVEIMGVLPKREYELTASLVDRETGKQIGKSVSKRITPSSQSCTVEMEIPVDLLDYSGKQVVVYETLSRDGRIVAKHEDPNDTEQTLRVLVPAIGTTARDGADGDSTVAADHEVEVIDTVAYRNLVPGREYTLKGRLMAMSTGKPLEVDGKAVEAEATFTPEDGSGEVDVTFSFDGSAIEGQSLVAFETLYRADREVASHADIDDEGQTVELVRPEVRTIARDAVDGDKVVAADEKVEVIDTVAYGNLVPGREYTLKGRLMAKSTGKPLEVDGKAVEAEATFTPEDGSGEVDVTFSFDGSAIEGQSLVAFETLCRADREVASHADINDEGQTVELVRAKVATVATDKTDGDHVVSPSKDAVIIDTVRYENLIPGKEYVVKGVLMDKATGKPLEVDGKAVEAEARFTPNEANGEIAVEFRFDASQLDGRELVAFETLYKNGVEVATHADLMDAAQTVKVSKQPEGAAFDKTGFDGRVLAALCVAGIGCASGLAVYAHRQKKEAEREDAE